MAKPAATSRPLVKILLVTVMNHTVNKIEGIGRGQHGHVLGCGVQVGGPSRVALVFQMVVKPRHVSTDHE